VGIRHFLIGRQALADNVADEAAQIEAQGRKLQKLAHRIAALEGAGQHQVEQNDGVERGMADAAHIAPIRRLAHEARVGDRIEAAVEVVLADQFVEADNLDRVGLLSAPLGAHRHAAPPDLPHHHSIMP